MGDDWQVRRVVHLLRLRLRRRHAHVQSTQRSTGTNKVSECELMPTKRRTCCLLNRLPKRPLWVVRSMYHLQIWIGAKLKMAFLAPWLFALPFALPMAHPCCYSHIKNGTFRPTFSRDEVSEWTQVELASLHLQTEAAYRLVDIILEPFIIAPFFIISYAVMLYTVRERSPQSKTFTFRWLRSTKAKIKKKRKRQKQSTDWHLWA